MLFNRRGKADDYRFLEINPSFATQSGIRNGRGKRMREITSQIEPYWLEAYGAVARTGKPVRFSNEMKGLKRWFDVYAFRLGEDGSPRVAVLFSDISRRKLTEETLRVAQAQLAVHAGRLEDMVVSRTTQLTNANRRLEESVVSIRMAKERYKALLMEAQVLQVKLRRLTHQILNTQEEERKQISRELHDEVVQTLVGINVELAALGKTVVGPAQGLRNRIAHTQRLVETAVGAVHRFARGLRPAVLDDLGLIPALHGFCKSLAARHKFKIQITAFTGIDALATDQRTVLYRVAQEALTNVARHAHATVARLHMTQIPGAIRMEVSDNGRSFSVKKILNGKNRRLGLVGMRERVEMVGGQLAIESAPGRGTVVRAELPFDFRKTKK
jgi:signal transduction histidine kinase